MVWKVIRYGEEGDEEERRGIGWGIIMGDGRFWRNWFNRNKNWSDENIISKKLYIKMEKGDERLLNEKLEEIEKYRGWGKECEGR